MRVIARSTLIKFGVENPRADEALKAWYAEAKRASWSTLAEVKAHYGNASILKDGRVVFNICAMSFSLLFGLTTISSPSTFGSLGHTRNMTKSIRKRSETLFPKVIKTERDHKRALERVDELFAAKPGTPEGDELELWLLLIEKYEEEVFPVDLPDPIEAIRFRMDQANLKQKDLVPMIGSKSKVSEILAGKRDLSLAMIRKLVDELGIPAGVLLRRRILFLLPRIFSNWGNAFHWLRCSSEIGLTVLSSL